MATDYRRYSNNTEEEEVVLDERCCFGYASAFACLPVLACITFFMDVGAACLSIGSDFIYFFGIIAIFSLLCFGAVLSGVQEEQSAKIKLSIGWVLVKMLLVTLFIFALIVALIDPTWFTELTRLNLDSNNCTGLLAFLPLHLILLILQLVWSRQMLEIIRIRDMLYIIPCEVGPVPLRNSLRVHLDSLKSKQYSISTILPAEKY
jgi:hypothetical protein